MTDKELIEILTKHIHTTDILLNISIFMFVWLLSCMVSFYIGIMLDLKVRYILVFPTIVAFVVVVCRIMLCIYGVEG